MSIINSRRGNRMIISKEFKMCCSHVLPRHPGKCSRLHGHNYKVVVGLGGVVNGETGFVLDYGELSAILRPIVERFDHQHLNLFIKYPSAENLATYIGWWLLKKLAGLGKFDVYVQVEETDSTTALWASENPKDAQRLVDVEDTGWHGTLSGDIISFGEFEAELNATFGILNPRPVQEKGDGN